MHDRTRRSFEPVTDRDLVRLAELGQQHHERFAASFPEWAGTLLATCLAQGAAQHRLHGDKGVKDFDVWLFYATPPGRSPAHFPWNRNTVQVDFGESLHGRQAYTDEDRAAHNVAAWECFDGRRVDLLARAIAPHPSGAHAAIAAWLERGRRQRGASSWWLAQAPVIDLSSGRIGETIWNPSLT